MNTSLLTCDPCSCKSVILDAIQFCSECKIKLCTQCLSNHNLNAAFSEHHLTDIEALSLDNFCTNHEGSILDFFCVVHDCLCCLSCKTEEHNSCPNVLSLEDAAKDVKDSVMFQDVLNSVSEIRTTLDKAIKSKYDNIKNLQDDEATVSSQLASYKAKKVDRLDELEGIIINETSLLKNEQIVKIESDKNNLVQVKSLVKEISRKIDQVSKYNSQKQLFVLMKKYSLEIIDLEMKLQKTLPTLVTSKMIFQPQEDIQNTIKSLGSTRLKNLQYMVGYKSHKNKQVQVPQMHLKLRFDSKIEIIRMIRKMDITDDNRILLCNYSSYLLVYSESGDYLQDCELSGKPWDIVVIPGEEKAVVTLPQEKSMQFIDIKTMTAGLTYSVPVGCNAVTIVNDKICLSGYLAGGNVYVFDKLGKYVNTVKIPNAGYIRYLHPGPGNSFYYTVIQSSAICCVTLEGKQLFSFSLTNHQRPNAVTTDENGSLYAVCEDSNNIQHIAQNRKYRDIIRYTKNCICSPTDILFSKDYRRLFVLNYMAGNTYVVVFSCS